MSHAFLRLSRKTADALASLAVREDERHLIAPNAEWLVQAAFTEEATTYGIGHDRQLVGMISLIDPRLVEDPEDADHFQAGHLYIWRLMVDHAHRGRGHARAAMNFAFDYARLVGLSGISLTTMDREEGNALGLYEKLGFRPTGRRLDGEIELVRGLDPH